MESWMPFFVIVVAIAVVMQAIILAAIFVMFKRMNQRVDETLNEVRSRVLPVLTGIQVLVEETRPHLVNVVANAAEVTNLARSQAQKMDRVVSEALERLRMQLAHVDQILTGTLETVENAGTKLRRSIWAPVQSVTAIVRGIQTGLEFYRGRRRPFEATGEREHQDEDLFI